jgi:hypothetical protein
MYFVFFSADTLNVRSSASSKSGIRGYLYFSSAILVLEKKKVGLWLNEMILRVIHI